VLLTNGACDHGGVGRECAGVVGDQQRAAGGRDVFDSLDLRAEPVAIEELDHRAVEDLLDPLRPAPVGEASLELDRGKQIAIADRWKRRFRGPLADRQARQRGALGRHGGSFWQQGYVSAAVRSKDQVRRAVWNAIDREGVSRFPGAEGRIPNFAGAKLAAEKLAGHRLWKRARVIKANPDSPQTHVRRTALEQGKIVIMAVPRMRDPHPFRLLDPKRLSKQEVREAATIKGALRHGRVVALDELPEIDFVLCGSVAVNLSGARIGKGGGFSDLEYGILIDAGRIDDHTTVATTVHPIQILRDHLMVTDHDLPVDLIATPRAVIEVERQYPRPRGILWDHLQPPQIREIPILERMGYA
jgi:5-formyltetrahydrofolate cyclo-ligase